MSQVQAETIGCSVGEWTTWGTVWEMTLWDAMSKERGFATIRADNMAPLESNGAGAISTSGKEK